MRRARGCLGERAIWRLREGEGTPADWAHLSGCPGCGARHRALTRDLALIQRVLQGPEPPPKAAPVRSPARRLVPAAGATLAICAALVAGGAWGRWHSAPGSTAATREDAMVFLEEISTALFPAAASAEVDMTSADPGVAELQAALDGKPAAATSPPRRIEKRSDS